MGSDYVDVVHILLHLAALLRIHVYVRKRHQHGIESMLKLTHACDFVSFVCFLLVRIDHHCTLEIMNEIHVTTNPSTGNLIPAVTKFNYITM